LECLGRIDDQVKLSGVRVELKEIEAALLRVAGVRQAAVAVANTAAGASRLVAYIETDEKLVPREIRLALSAWLPPVMIPPSYIFLKKFPVNLSGKVDRVSLLQIEQPLPSTVPRQAQPSVFLALLCRLQARLQGRAGQGQSIEAATARAVETAWRRTLPHAAFDHDVSWTDAGGDSLAMLQLLLRLEQALGRKLGFDLLFSEMTPRELIGRLLQDDVAAEPGSSFPIVHLVPGISGDQPALANFRRAFAGMVRFALIEPPELKADGATLRSVKATGRSVAGAIAERQPTGSIILAGFSFGGAVAFEAAKQLLEDGRRVALLMVLDTPIYVGSDGSFERSPSEKSYYAWLRKPLLKLLEVDIARRGLIPLASVLGCLNLSDFRRELLRHFRIDALQSWRPEAVSVPAVILLSEAFGPVNRAQWTRLLPAGTVVDIPGGHTEVIASRALALCEPILLKAIVGAASGEATA
jgi:thioesterase domain-containing protein